MDAAKSSLIQEQTNAIVRSLTKLFG